MTSWRARAVALASVGAVGAVGCSEPEPAGDPVEMRRWGYASVEACGQDYPGAPCEVLMDFAARHDCLLQKDLSVCNAEALASGSAYAWGPWHALEAGDVMPDDPGPGATAIAGVSQVAVKNETTMRGGFGSTSSSDSGRHSGG